MTKLETSRDGAAISQVKSFEREVEPVINYCAILRGTIFHISSSHQEDQCAGTVISQIESDPIASDKLSPHRGCDIFRATAIPFLVFVR